LPWFPNVFAGGGIAPPLPSWLSNLLGFALGSFCSLQAFRIALEDESENGGLPISALEELRTRGPAPQCAPREKQSVTPISPVSSRTPCSPSQAFLSLAPDPMWSLETQQIPVVRFHATSPRGRKGSLPGSATCWVPAGGAVARLCHGSRFIATPS